MITIMMIHVIKAISGGGLETDKVSGFLLL